MLKRMGRGSRRNNGEALSPAGAIGLLLFLICYVGAFYGLSAIAGQVFAVAVLVLLPVALVVHFLIFDRS